MDLPTLDDENQSSNTAVLKPWGNSITVYCSSPFSCINEYLSTYSGGHLCEQPMPINCSMAVFFTDKLRWRSKEEICQGRGRPE